MYRTWKFGLLCIGLIASGFILIYAWPNHEWSIAFGHALVIAGVLAGTVDWFVKQRFLREVSRDVSKYLIGYELPREVQDRIKQLMNTKLIRRNYRIHYRILQENDQPKVKLLVDFSFEVENITSEPQSYQQHLAFEKHDNPTVLELRCDSADEKAVYCRAKDIVLQEKSDEPGVLEERGKRIRIQPHNRERGIQYSVAGKYFLIYPENYSDIFSFGAPTINATVTAEYPENFEFVAPAGDLVTTRRWEYQRLFLPSEHIHIRWFTKQQESKN